MKQQAITWVDGPVIGSRGLRAWVSTLKKHAPECELVICSPTPCQLEGTKNTTFNIPGASWLPRRWAAYADAIKQSDADQILLSDSRDIIFQSDPFSLLNGEAKIIVADEHLTPLDHPWCRDKEKEVRAKLGCKSLENQKVINGGLQIGQRDAMLIFAYAMEGVMRLNAFSTDQAFLNWWFYERCPVKWSFGRPGWYLHGSSVQLKKQHLELKDGLAWTKNGSDTIEPAVAFHQYDRCGHANFADSFASMSESPVLIVVAHHQNENVNWLARFRHEALVVSKGDKPPTYIGAVTLPNVGYEAQTWAWFFAENYDKLPEVIVCLQGNPFPHCPEPQIQEVIRKMQTGRFGYAPICGPGHGALTWLDNVTHHAGLPLTDYWKRIFKSQPPAWLYVFYGGQFAVHRDVVRARPREFWQKMAKECITKEDACCQERLWQFVFTGTP